MTTEIDSTSDVLDVRDIIRRVEELREERDAFTTKRLREKFSRGPEGEELTDLESLLEDLRGKGGDEQWEGSWYPGTLIHDAYFVTAMEELVQDIGDVPKEIPGYLAIDWEQTAENLRVDYSSVEFDGFTFWYR